MYLHFWPDWIVDKFSIVQMLHTTLAKNGLFPVFCPSILRVFLGFGWSGQSYGRRHGQIYIPTFFAGPSGPGFRSPTPAQVYDPTYGYYRYTFIHMLRGNS